MRHVATQRQVSVDLATAPVPLDVRPVEPKDRYARIMGAYDGLAVGRVLDLTVDHDPRCMYYTLKGTRGDEAFSFDYLEEGPEVWRVLVRKLQAAGGS